MASDAEDEIEEVDDYQDWAQEQAMATCELMGCSWQWSRNVFGERYIIFDLEYEPGFFDFWEGYHYYP